MSVTRDERFYQVALHFTPGIGHFMFRQLLAYCGSAEEVFKVKKGKLGKIPGIGPKAIEFLQSEEGIRKAEEEILKLEGKPIRLITFTDKAYPDRLKHMPDSPPVLFLAGNAEILQAPRTLAIVGTRNATDYGKKVTEEIVAFCKGRNIAIISGLAYGIDITAHRAALQHDVPTLAVIGSGLDKIYPSLHKEIARQMCQTGGVITEYPLGTVAEAFHFPARNRIVAGFSDALIVIESAKKGGALITAELAIGYNKDVYAVPGNIYNPYSLGCNALIQRQKAQIYTHAELMFEEIGWADGDSISPKESLKNWKESDFSQEEWLIITALKEAGGDGLLDELSWRTQLAVSQVANHLLQLEFRGLIRALPGKRYRLEA
jgi:DNA processing protein